MKPNPPARKPSVTPPGSASGFARASPDKSLPRGEPGLPRRSSSRRRERSRDLLAVAVLALTTAVVFWKGFFPPPGDSMIRGDAAYLYQPYYEMAAQEVRAGRLPLWNPYILGGVPFHASLQPALLYPLRWPMFFLPYVPGYVLTICLHYFLGAVAAYLFLRAAVGVGPLAGLLGAMSIAFGGLSLGHASHPNYFLAYPWFFGAMTCLWLAMRRNSWRWIAPGGACIGLMCLIGAVHLLLVLGVLLGTYAGYHAVVALAAFLRDRKAGWAPIVRPPAVMVAMIALGGLIGAAQVLPARTLSKASVRQEAGWEFINMAVASPGKTALLMVAPFSYGDMRLGYWGEFSRDEMAHYVGIAVLIAAAAGLATIGRDRHLWALVVLGLVGIALGAGKTLPFYKILYENIGPFRQLRNPTRIFWLTDIALACLGAVGVQRLLSGPAGDRPARRARMASAALGAIILATLAGAMMMQYHYAARPEAAAKVLDTNPQVHKDMWYPVRDWCARNAPGRTVADPVIWFGLAAAVLSVALMAWLLLRPSTSLGQGRPAPRWAGGAIVLLLAADLFAMSWGLVMYDKLFWLTEGTPPRARWLQEQLGRDAQRLGPQRYAVWATDHKPTPDDQIQPNRGMQFGIRHLGGVGGGIVDSPARSRFIALTSQPIPLRRPGGQPVLSFDLMNVLKNVAAVRYVFVERGLEVPAEAMQLRLIPASPGRSPAGPDGNASDDAALRDARYRVYENTGCLPAAFFVPAVRQAPPEAALPTMAARDFDPRQTALVYGPPPAETAQSPATRLEVAKVLAVPGRWEVHTDTDAPAQLVISEGHNAGWRCRIGGQDVKVYQTFDQLMSVPVPAGRQTVVLRYKPAEFRSGLILTAAGVALAIGLAVAQAVATRRRHALAPADEKAPSAPARPKAGRKARS